jgi:hypothetical protein
MHGERALGTGCVGVRMSVLTGCLSVGLALSGCGGNSAMTMPSEAAQRTVARHFAAALLRGDTAGARALLLRSDEDALVYLVRQAAAPWRTDHASIQLAPRRTGDRWTVRYAGTRSYRDGRFERERGDILVFVAPSAAGARVQFFVFTHVRTRFSTHHDAQLPPSKR